VELNHLTNPDFLSLLEQAKEEYGFQQEGVLAVPCRPEELQKILENRRKRRASTEW
jgi:SAUR family protein